LGSGQKPELNRDLKPKQRLEPSQRLGLKPVRKLDPSQELESVLGLRPSQKQLKHPSVGRNGFHRDTESSKRLVANVVPEPEDFGQRFESGQKPGPSQDLKPEQKLGFGPWVGAGSKIGSRIVSRILAKPGIETQPGFRAKPKLRIQSKIWAEPVRGLKHPSVSRSGFHRDTETSDRLIAKRRLKTPGQAAGCPEASVFLQASKPGRASECLSASANRNGFTLVEIIVALCIVAILTAIVVPGFRKTMQDLKLNECVCNIECVIKACRNYYLIFNEFPPNGSDHMVPAGKIRCFLPNHLYKGDRFTYVPLGKSGNAFDFENTLGWNNCSIMQAGLSWCIGNANDFKMVWDKLQSLDDYKKHIYNVKDTYLSKDKDMYYDFPEFPRKTESIRRAENRYY
jgi:prepilin-type N-terminal cleavage/methylation domain-containing protein